MTQSKKTVRTSDDAWIKHELSSSISTPSIDQKELFWSPLNTEMVSRSYMSETNGGGQIESIPGIDVGRAMTAGLPIGQQQETSIVTGMVAQSTRVKSGLIPVTDTTRTPWRCICQLIITRQDHTKQYGTAWLAGPALLVTAGHCILDHDYGGWASSITVIPGGNGTYPPPFNMWQASHIEAHQAWVNKRSREFDYGFITLPDANIGKQLGWFGFSVLPDQKLANLMVNVAGYPTKKTAGTMWFNSGRIVDADQAFLRYMIETETGESGGPVFWYGRDDQRIVIATHAYYEMDANKGVRITPEMYKRILQLRGF